MTLLRVHVKLMSYNHLICAPHVHGTPYMGRESSTESPCKEKLMMSEVSLFILRLLFGRFLFTVTFKFQIKNEYFLFLFFFGGGGV